MFRTLRRDAERYREIGGWLVNAGFWLVAIYRFGAWAHTLPTVVKYPVLVVYWLLKQPWRLLFHVELPARAAIGPGLMLQHPYNVIIPKGTRIGSDCTLFHEVTIGMGPLPGMARLEDHVVLFAGARILGGVTIGERSEIGANCVVSRDVPPGMAVMQMPVRPIPLALLRGGAAAGAGPAPARPAEATGREATSAARQPDPEGSS